MARDGDDPRSLHELDLYEVVTSDEEEDSKIASQLNELERQRKDLQERLQLKAQRRKDLSQLVKKKVEIPASPKKQRDDLRSQSIIENTSLGKDIDLQDDSYISKLGARIEESGHSTPYFLENFANVRKAEEKKIQHRNDLMNCRVHTFKGLSEVKQQEPIVVEEKEDFSGLRITRRYIPTEDLNEILRDIKVLRLPKLFGKVRPPKFSEPDYANWVAIGIMSFKSPVKLTSASKPSKYFKFTITDFQHNLDVYVFGNKNVEKYYNLRIGDVIAILNPDVLPWRPSQVGNDEFSGAVVKSFNLSIRHNYDCIIEVGTSKDLAFCQIYNKSASKICGAPINSASTDRCEFHQELRFRQVNAQRVELNGSTPMRSPTKNGKKQALYGNSTSKKKYELLPDKHLPQQQDRESQNTLYFSNPNYARAFFDDSYQNPDLLNNLEGKRRKLKENEKEKFLQDELNKAVGKGGNERFKNMSEQEKKRIKLATEQALDSGLVKNIGFDPTKGRMKDILIHGQNQKKSLDAKSSQVKEIMKMKKANINLAPSKEEQKKRLLKREQVWKEHFKNSKQKVTPAIVKEDVDSDSDLEII
ncbi:LANO_0E05644g1_1 [Lachancea nothofagi CBS 11611]|uniref:LANO_0E05644g1_1 n=1 Tax=Lachancea nothofagi CBS 11611 TaxID=1266666 RepID=A0A1G4JTA1_9SACH|nr:LANO_0E05644g1_1 [Lachancea nothofagi CBS 11611]